MDVDTDVDCEEPGPSQNQSWRSKAGTRPESNLTSNERYNNARSNQATQNPRRGQPENWRQRDTNAGTTTAFQWNRPRTDGNDNMQQRNNGPVRHNQRNNIRPLSREMKSMSLQTTSRGKDVGFNYLLELSKSDSKQIIGSINVRREAFLQLLQSPIERLDLYVLIVKILTIVSKSSFEQIRSNLLLDVCNSQFITNLRNYLMDLPYTEERSSNTMYWDKPEEFWENFISFCDYIIKTMPSIAMFKCKTLIEGTTKCCLEGLSQKHDFNLSEELVEKLEVMRRKLITQEEESKGVTSAKGYETEPPENFRLLSILPQVEDLVGCRPYLRPNIVEGRYADVEHYLDVQFRLLREDCFGPLRDGISQFVQNPNERKYDNIRVFRNVKFAEPYVSADKIGMMVQVDANTTKWFRTINWAQSKRLIYGSLVLLTKDNCKTFIVATILDRDMKHLNNGMIPISLVDKTIDDYICKTNESYIMIESDVYFEPYFHVLRALQDPTFPEHIAMSKYIVQVDSIPRHPRYLRENSIYRYPNSDYKFKVLDESTWPSSVEMGFNESQYEAYRLALTHEFAVIQGPPGTGKTFLGVKIAETLIKNRTENGCLILLICYTNHALDQFLEAILKITRSIARIGGQSRNEAMEMYNLNFLRHVARMKRKKVGWRTYDLDDSYEFDELYDLDGQSKLNVDLDELNKLFLQKRSILEDIVICLQEKIKIIEIIDGNNGVLNFHYVKKYIEESGVIKDFYDKRRTDPLHKWLFENMPIISLDSNIYKKEELPTNADVVDDDIYKRDNIILDDFDDMDDYKIEISGAFLINDAEINLWKTIYEYRKEKDIHLKNKLEAEIIVKTSRIKMYQKMSKLRLRSEHLEMESGDPTRYTNEERWRIYFGWAQRIKQELKKEIRNLQTCLQVANEEYEEVRMMMDLAILRNVKVVGMTTTGAARLRKVLQALAPPIVIVEEAAEVLEQHIVTSLTKDCQHLILIGDHQQLRPSASHMRMARDFNLDVSLFERMIKNNIHSRRLSVQHRMRPEIAALISPHIYLDLSNHESVERFPNVRGMCNNLFFFTHNYQEEQVDDNTSKANHKEADMVLRLANYLMQQGYDPSEVTILAAYSGQMFYMRNQRERYAHLSEVKITIVDNYQGEESRIILLSLVRNNIGGHIGFLKTENRVCVALSRAREGFYIFGNINILKTNSNLWVKIAETLEQQNSLGTSLQVRCDEHYHKTTTITNVTDFEEVPEGGCLVKCIFKLPSCNHRCPLVCHGYDLKHIFIKCPLKCERVICELGHVCPLTCWQECGPCEVPVTKELPCGHSQDLPCSVKPTDSGVRCNVTVDFTFPRCGHRINKPCYVDECPIICGGPLKCGHTCVRTCHVPIDPDHKRYHTCEQPCLKAKNGCSMKMEGDLGPHRCPKMCYQPCEYCKVEVKKTIPDCGHEVMFECASVPAREHCTARDVSARDAPCGHRVRPPCAGYPPGNYEFDGKALVELCTAACDATLACGHACGGDCARCRRARLHAPCARRCALPRACGHPCEAKCNEVCPPCAKPCEVECEHSKCKNLCGEPCVPCKEQCPARRPDISGERSADKSVLLEDRNHVLEREYGTEAQIKAKKAELVAKVRMIVDNPPKIYTDKVWLVQKWCTAFVIFLKKVNMKMKLSLPQLEMQFVYLNILESLSDTYNLYIDANLVEFKDEVIQQIDLICETLINNANKISQQQKQDIEKEIKRTNSIIQLAKIASNPDYKSLQEQPKVKAAFDKAKAVITHWAVYDENMGITRMKLLQEEINIPDVDTKHECESPIGPKGGQWYKCPNGHINYNKEGDEPINELKCNECDGVKRGRWYKCPNGHINCNEGDEPINELKCNECDGVKRGRWYKCPNGHINCNEGDEPINELKCNECDGVKRGRWYKCPNGHINCNEGDEPINELKCNECDGVKRGRLYKCPNGHINCNEGDEPINELKCNECDGVKRGRWYKCPNGHINCNEGDEPINELKCNECDGVKRGRWYKCPNGHINCNEGDEPINELKCNECDGVKRGRWYKCPNGHINCNEGDEPINELKCNECDGVKRGRLYKCPNGHINCNEGDEPINELKCNECDGVKRGRWYKCPNGHINCNEGDEPINELKCNECDGVKRGRWYKCPNGHINCNEGDEPINELKCNECDGVKRGRLYKCPNGHINCNEGDEPINELKCNECDGVKRGRWYKCPNGHINCNEGDEPINELKCNECDGVKRGRWYKCPNGHINCNEGDEPINELKCNECDGVKRGRWYKCPNGHINCNEGDEPINELKCNECDGVKRGRWYKCPNGHINCNEGDEPINELKCNECDGVKRGRWYKCPNGHINCNKGDEPINELKCNECDGVKRGRWYKCPNGHIYCNKECDEATDLDEAMKKLKCNECGAAFDLN
ncbi:uncharacterized protein [Epargyreus clarus]|uniref:uncharacterized protein isoform X2 n=1 Tax=Epargyreus clarus TaxID=520877 RepID=UPI003C2E942D